MGNGERGNGEVEMGKGKWGRGKGEGKVGKAEVQIESFSRGSFSCFGLSSTPPGTPRPPSATPGDRGDTETPQCHPRGHQRPPSAAPVTPRVSHRAPPLLSLGDTGAIGDPGATPR